MTTNLTPGYPWSAHSTMSAGPEAAASPAWTGPQPTLNSSWLRTTTATTPLMIPMESASCGTPSSRRQLRRIFSIVNRRLWVLLLLGKLKFLPEKLQCWDSEWRIKTKAISTWDISFYVLWLTTLIFLKFIIPETFTFSIILSSTILSSLCIFSFFCFFIFIYLLY